MNTEEFLLAPVKLNIVQDWTEVLSRAQDLIFRSKTHNTEILPYGNSTFYHIGPMGSVIQHDISESWHNVVGPWTNRYLPWLKTMMSDMAELEPRYAISVMVGNGGEHTDFDDVPTAFNYPIETTSAETYVNYQGQEYTYPSLANKPWILNTQYPHGVRNSEFRAVFNLHFGKEYSIVKQWFDSHPNLIYS
jgi:hypothetical protein